MKTPVTSQKKSTPAPASYQIDELDSRDKNPFDGWDNAILQGLKDTPIPKGTAPGKTV